MSATSLATVTASTLRRPAPSGGLIGAPESSIASFLITPFQSVSAELALEATIQDASESKVCHAFTSGGSLYDVKEGDILVVSGTEYDIQHVAEFNRGVDSYSRIIVNERKVN